MKGERYRTTSHCVVCDRERVRERYRTNLEYKARSLAYSNRRNRVLRQDVAYCARRNERAYELRRADPEYRTWYNAYVREWTRKRKIADPAFTLVGKLRKRITGALRTNRKSAHAIDLLGVPSMTFYKAYLESQFEPGMTWGNAGTAWHIDHRIPLSLLDLSKPEDQRFGFNYKNTRPMWAKANISRSNNLQFEDLI